MSVPAEKIVVTGAAGHLGSALIDELSTAGFKVTGLDIAEPASALPSGCRFRQVDLVDPKALKAALAGTGLIVHCASIHPWKKYSDRQYIDCNITGTWNLYTAAAELEINRVVLTSSIAAIGYSSYRPEDWPVVEDDMFALGDLYSYTKHAQEDIARMYADSGRVRTIALRPPAFMPRSNLETGFSLTANFAVVQDIVAAHLAAIRVMSGLQQVPEPLKPFEAFFVTNKLPYRREDFYLLEPDRNVRRLVERYWREAYRWLVGRGYRGASLVAVYDLSKARRLLNWQPAFNFEQWFARNAGEL